MSIVSWATNSNFELAHAVSMITCKLGVMAYLSFTEMATVPYFNVRSDHTTES